MSENDITLRVIYEQEEYELHTFAGEYRNLMMLIYDKIFIDEFGDCKGMGRCGTCVVEVIESRGPLTSLNRNEESTLHKIGVNHSQLRLSCQIMTDRAVDGAVFKIHQP